MKYSKTVYIEVEAPDEDAAEAIVNEALSGLDVLNIDTEGPIEEVSE